MKIKYWGAEYEKGLTLTVSLFDREGNPVLQDIPMTETATDSAIYKTDPIESVTTPGIYVTRVIDSDGNFIGHEELIYNGVQEISLLDLKFLTDTELMQLRDSLGIDGAKMVARDGQLQKKSEYPTNELVDSTKV